MISSAVSLIESMSCSNFFIMRDNVLSERIAYTKHIATNIHKQTKPTEEIIKKISAEVLVFMPQS